MCSPGRNSANVGQTHRSAPTGAIRMETKILRYMKKTYVSPLMVEVNVEAESMLAASLKLDGNKTVDTSNGGQLTGGSRGEWGNLWN